MSPSKPKPDANLRDVRLTHSNDLLPYEVVDWGLDCRPGTALDCPGLATPRLSRGCASKTMSPPAHDPSQLLETLRSPRRSNLDEGRKPISFLSVDRAARSQNLYAEVDRPRYIWMHNGKLHKSKYARS